LVPVQSSVRSGPSGQAGDRHARSLDLIYIPRGTRVFIRIIHISFMINDRRSRLKGEYLFDEIPLVAGLEDDDFDQLTQGCVSEPGTGRAMIVLRAMSVDSLWFLLPISISILYSIDPSKPFLDPFLSLFLPPPPTSLLDVTPQPTALHALHSSFSLRSLDPLSRVAFYSSCGQVITPHISASGFVPLTTFFWIVHHINQLSGLSL
jgi:hypothetical protein